MRREAVSALSWLQQDQAITILAKIAETDVDDEVRRIATGGLAYSQNISVEVIQALQHSLTSESWQLRVEAALRLEITYCSARSSFNSCCIRLVLASTYCSSTELGTT